MQIITVGLDLAKRVFQVHGVDAAGGVMGRSVPKPARQCSHGSKPTSRNCRLPTHRLPAECWGGDS
jgi:hypothetical protein